MIYMKEKNLKYINILNRIHKKLSTLEGLLIIKKQYFINNIFYYLLSLILRFIYLLSFIGDYQIFFDDNNSNKLYQKYLRKLTCYHIIKVFKLSFNYYFYSIIIIFIISLIRTVINIYILKRINNYKNTNTWPLPNKYIIIIDHIRFAIFPYLIEYISFCYYILILADKFIPSLNTLNKSQLIVLIVICSLLFILYNFELYWDMICINKKFTISIHEIPKNCNQIKYKKNNHFFYKCSENFLFVLIIFQNSSIILNIEYYIDNKKIFRLIVTIIIFIFILIILYKLLNTYNYQNSILIIMNILFLYCFNSIIIDLIIAKYMKTKLNLFINIIYFILKLILSDIMFYLILLKRNNFFKKIIIQLLFLENNDKIKSNFIDSLYYLHEIMLTIKMQQSIENAYLIIKYINNKHTNNCNKSICNCKLLNSFINEKIILDKDEITEYSEKLIIILNYLFESFFINFDYFYNYDASVLLAEHYCHNKDNPIMAFSIINTFFMKQKSNKLSKEKKIALYELSQKYIYYITSKFMIIKESSQDEEEFLLNDKREKESNSYFSTLKMIGKIKNNMLNYISNYITILKYKNIFDDSLSFIYDENSENIIYIKNNFFKQINEIELGDNNKNYNLKNNENQTNLYRVIYLLKNEKLLYHKIIKSMIYLNDMDNLPIEIMFKFILFINIFEIKNNKNELKRKIAKCLNKKTKDNKSYIYKNEYEILKTYYKKQNNEKDSKMYVIFEFKREIIIKYFSEFGALKLGLTQNEIINNNMDILLPKIFRNSHLNVIKYFIINQQTKLNFHKQIYFFDKTNTILYPINTKVSFIYNINKYLNFLSENIFIYDNKYRFMLDNNLKLMANSNNFEEDYFLNQKISQIYNLSIIDLLDINTDDLKDVFKNEIKAIYRQKIIRQAKTEEYILPQLYVPPDEKPISMMNTNFFKKSKNKIISKILNQDNNIMDQLPEDEKEKINCLNFKNKNNDYFLELFKSETIVYYKNYYKTLNKKYFIEKIGKELLKIPENDLILEKDKKIHNLIINAKKLINKLLNKKELSSKYIQISIDFRYYYDKSFFFITIEDENSSLVNIRKNINFENNKQDTLFTSNILKKNNSKKNSNKTPENENKIIKNQKTIEKEENNLFNELEEIRAKINDKKMATIITYILIILIIIILVINAVIIYHQKTITTSIDIILSTFFYNNHAKNVILCIYSTVLQLFYDYSNFTENNINSDDEFQLILNSLTFQFQANFHNFTTFFIAQKILLGTNADLMFKKENFSKIKIFWKEIKYISDYTIEGNFLSYFLYSLNISNIKYIKAQNPDLYQKDINKFISYKETIDNKEKINTSFIRLVYYICNNYEFILRRLYDLFEEEIYNDYKIYVGAKMFIYKILEITEIILTIVNYIIIIVLLLYSNKAIVKNIILLFLDFNDNNYKNKKNDSKTIYKLYEIKKIIEDFNLKRFDKYIENTNKNDINLLSYNSIENKENNNKNVSLISSNESKKNSNYNLGKESIDKMFSYAKTRNNNFADFKNRGNKNNSSYNNLSGSLSQLIKINSKKDSIKDDKKLDFNISHNNKKSNEENEVNIHELIINSSNNIYILIIIIVFVILSIFTIGLIIFNYYKLYTNIKMDQDVDVFFIDLVVITNRYNILFYSYNIFRTMIIFPEGDKKRKFEEIMENMENYFEEENNKYLNIISSEVMVKHFYRTKRLMLNLTDSKNNSTEKLKDLICGNFVSCQNYLDSENNFFDSGLDFGYKSAMTFINNMYLDYKRLNDNYDMDIINETIINNKNSHFKDIGLALNNLILLVFDKLFFCFKDDINEFLLFKISNTNLYYVIAFILSIFVFIISFGISFISIFNYMESLKESSYRLSCSFYSIKKD